LDCSPPVKESFRDQFVPIPQRIPVEPGLLDEASGLAASQTIAGHFWVNEDSGNPAQLNLLATNGTLAGRIPIPGISNRDWEEIAIGPGPQAGVSYLYIGDIGDNQSQNEMNYVFRLAEPKSLSEAVGPVDRISFRYADGARDAEALLVDPQSNDIWIVTKGEARVRLYHLPYPQSVSTVNTATFMGDLPLTMVTAGSISPKGEEILLKTYLGVYYWRRYTGESIGDCLLKTTPTQLNYLLEPQGEAIAFDQSDSGFYTLSERSNAPAVTLNYYKHR
jgi:hypothetical protein